MTDAAQSKGYDFKILSENVAVQDAFEDKTHERVSENLFRVITQSDKGVTIGLEGSWGAGKSTVIKLLRDKLKERDSKSLVFMFDAWAHDGDPLRRIFLESLIRAIDPDNKNEKLNWIKSKITGRTKIVEVKGKKKVSLLGKLISFSALAIPLGSALLNKVKFESLVFPWESSAITPHWMFAIGLNLCLAPLWMLLLWRIFGEKDPLTKKTNWEYFSTDSTEDYTQDITEDNERSSIEFEDYFQDIMKCAIEDQSINKCIVVVDNLDRIDPTHAKNIWSTLQTFFQRRSDNSNESDWADKLWFVIPFDQQGFIKIWSATGDGNDVAKSFLKKCFQLIAEVPPPVMTGWSEYAKLCVENALTGWPKSDLEEVLAIYIRYAGKLEVSPTPRDIKSFVNQLGLIGAMWGGSVSVEALCLYTLLKETNTVGAIRSALVRGELPNNYQTETDRNLICSEIAGLLFGVSRDKGLQLLLAPEIKDAFKNGNSDAIRNLSAIHGHAFWIAYETSKDLWMISPTHSDEYKITFSDVFYHGLIENRSKIRNDVKQVIRVWEESLTRIDLEEFDCSESLGYLLDLSPEPAKFFESIKKFVSAKFEEYISQIETPEFPSEALQNLSLIVKLIESRGVLVPKRQYPKMTAQKWKLWLGHLVDNDVEFDMILPNNDAIKSILKGAQFSENSYNEEELEALSLTYDRYPESPDWALAAVQVINWLNLETRKFDCEDIYSFVLKLASDEKLFVKIQSCVKSTKFWAAQNNSTSTEIYELSTLAAICFEEKIQEAEFVSPNVKEFWRSMRSDDILDKIYEKFKYLNKIDVIWFLCRDQRNQLAIEIIRKVNDTRLFKEYAGTRFIDEFLWAVEGELATIAEKLVQHGSFVEEQEAMSDDPKIYQDVFLIFYSLNNPIVCKFIDEQVLNLNKDEWKDIFAKNGKMLEVVKERNPTFSDALKEYLVDLVSGKLSDPAQVLFVNSVPKLLEKTTDLDRIIIPKLCDAYFMTEVDHLDNSAFEILSPFFKMHSSHVDESALMMRIINWIENDETARIEWLVSQEIKPFNNPLEGLIGRIELGLKSDSEAKKQIAMRINEKFALGVVIEVQLAEDHSDGEFDSNISTNTKLES